ncbi:MAG: potassium-transporting ATPase subunit F [Halanaerobiales bacterium]
MEIGNILLGVVSIFVFIYLIYVLINPTGF